MKHIPILFSTPMVQAILEGRKTMTRRIATDIPDDDVKVWHDGGEWIVQNKFGQCLNKKIECRYGNPGDVLWVRETFTLSSARWCYKADGGWTDEQIEMGENNRWRPSIFMPKYACRIFLKVKSVRVELLNDISDSDAINEGIETTTVTSVAGKSERIYKHYLKDRWGPSPKHSFQTLWEKINGPKSWDANPWVWVIEFEPCEKPANFLTL